MTTAPASARWTRRTAGRATNRASREQVGDRRVRARCCRCRRSTRRCRTTSRGTPSPSLAAGEPFQLMRLDVCRQGGQARFEPDHGSPIGVERRCDPASGHLHRGTDDVRGRIEVRATRLDEEQQQTRRRHATHGGTGWTTRRPGQAGTTSTNGTLRLASRPLPRCLPQSDARRRQHHGVDHGRRAP